MASLTKQCLFCHLKNHSKGREHFPSERKEHMTWDRREHVLKSRVPAEDSQKGEDEQTVQITFLSREITNFLDGASELQGVRMGGQCIFS